MSTLAKILSLSYNSASATKASALKTYYRSVRMIKDTNTLTPTKPSYFYSVLLNGNCLDPENRKLYTFYLDTYYNQFWIFETDIDTHDQGVVFFGETNQFGLDGRYKIYNARVVQGTLIFTDNKNPVYQMNISRAKKSFYFGIGYGQYPEVTEWDRTRMYRIGEIVWRGRYFYKNLIATDTLDPLYYSTYWQSLCPVEDAYFSTKQENYYFAPIPPKFGPIPEYFSDSSRKPNNLRQSIWQFAYRYVYMDYRKSTFSPACVPVTPRGEEDISTGLANELVELNNGIKLKVNTGGEEVRRIEIVGRNNSDPATWYLIDVIDLFDELEGTVQKSMDVIVKALKCSITITVPDPVVININGPDAPVASIATSIIPTGFTANWAESVNATGYYLDVATSNTFVTFVPGYQNKDIGNNLSEVVTGLTAASQYYYRVRAYNTGGTSDSSNAITVTTSATVPAAPVATAATNIFRTSFTANWEASAGTTKYYLDVAIDSGFTLFVPGYHFKDCGNVLETEVTGLSSNTTYYYRIKAYNAGGYSEYSNVITAVSYPSVPPTPTAITAIDILNTSFRARWNSETGVLGYYLDVATDIGFTSFVPGYQNKDVGSVNYCDVTGLTFSTTYYYRVRTYIVGTSANSNTITTATIAIAPDAPVASAATSILTTSFTANWLESVSATGYYLDVATDSNFVTMVAGYNNKNIGNNLSAAVVGLTASSQYYYRVRAYNLEGTSGNSNVITATTLAAWTLTIAGGYPTRLFDTTSVLFDYTGPSLMVKFSVQPKPNTLWIYANYQLSGDESGVQIDVVHDSNILAGSAWKLEIEYPFESNTWYDEGHGTL